MFAAHTLGFGKLLKHLFIYWHFIYPIIEVFLYFYVTELHMVFIDIHLVVVILYRHVMVYFLGFFHLIPSLLFVNHLIRICLDGYMFRLIFFILIGS